MNFFKCTHNPLTVKFYLTTICFSDEQIHPINSFCYLIKREIYWEILNIKSTSSISGTAVKNLMFAFIFRSQPHSFEITKYFTLCLLR